MKIVFMGTPDFAVPTLEALYQSRHEVAAVVTQPDKPKGRGKAMAMPPVKEKALEYGIPVYQPVRVRKDEAFFEELTKIQPDVIVVIAFRPDSAGADSEPAEIRLYQHPCVASAKIPWGSPDPVGGHQWR